MKERGRIDQQRLEAPFPVVDRFTVSGLCVRDLCFVCGSRVVEIAGEEPMSFAWCECDFPEDHHEMEML